MTTRLWWVRPEDFQASPAALALLNAEERQQQQRYIPPAKRHEYLVTRVLVRSVLGEALGIAPAALQFVHNEWGRPALAPGSSSVPLHFNISHTEGLVVCLVSTTPEGGVDTELLSRAPRLLALAPNVFAPKELSDLAALSVDQQAQRAVHLWTLKESYIKARGMGLALPLDGFAFHFAGERISLEVEPALQDDGERWQFQTQMLGTHCVTTAIALPRGWRQAGMEAQVLAVNGVETHRFSKCY
jgi:4'-phosphopantetheinyl transferase